MSDVQRASLDTLREFANKVREAGGGNPIDALIPAVPGNAKECLIAKNLNFNCEVNKNCGLGWVMEVGNNKELANKIGEALGLDIDEERFEDGYYNDLDEWVDSSEDHYMIVLPEEIGQVAEDFDEFFVRDEAHFSQEVLENDPDLAEFLPFIEESYKEVRSIGVIKDGKLLL